MSKVTDKDETLAEDTELQDASATEIELPAADAERAIALLQSWCETDTREQHETREFLKRALGQDQIIKVRGGSYE